MQRWMRFSALALAALAAVMLSAPGAIADQVRTERVKFARGESSADIRGSVRGRDTMHYLIGAGAGQYMTVELATRSTSAYFNIFAPGKKPGRDEALFIGDTGGNRFEGELPASGDYLIQVYLYRNAARRNESATFTLKVGIDADDAASTPPSNDATVAGTDFNATGEIPCARYAGQPMRQCKFGVVREGGGDGMVTVFWPDGGSRVLFFEGGEATSFDRSQADGNADLRVDRNADLQIITIGDERFEIPDAVVVGG